MATLTPTCPPPAPSCLPVAIASADHAYGEVGRPFAWYIQIEGGPAVLNLVGLPSWALFDPASNKISGIPTSSDDWTVQVTADAGDCGEDTQSLVISIVASLIIWGNWQDPVPEQFTAHDFLSGHGRWASNPGGYNVEDRQNRLGTYEFSVPPAGPNWWQVMWVPDLYLGTPAVPLAGVRKIDPLIQIKVQGFPFLLDPAPNTPKQSLTLGGIPGKLFQSIAPNNGGFTVSGNNPWVIS